MSYGYALYYPYIQLSNERWIKVASLYYDGLSRIVPPSIRADDSRLIRLLNDEFGFVRNLDPVASAEPAAADFLEFGHKYLQDTAFRVRLESELRELIDQTAEIRIYAEKLSDALRIELPRLGLASHSSSERHEHWDHYTFRPVTGAMYMACLANRMAAEHGLPLVSDHPAYQRLIRGTQDVAVCDRDAFDRSYLLGSAVIESVIPEDLDALPPEQIIAFRKRHDDERHRFYDAVNALGKDIPNIQDATSLRDA